MTTAKFMKIIVTVIAIIAQPVLVTTLTSLISVMKMVCINEMMKRVNSL